MNRFLLLVALALLTACSVELPPAAVPVNELPSDPPIVARPNPPLASMPADCFMRSDFVLDTTSLPTVPITRAEVELRTNPFGDRPMPVAVVLARLTMSLTDRHGNPLQSRPVWVVYRTGLMSKLPSGGPLIPGGGPVTTRPIYRSTASVTVLDAVTGEGIWATSCGIVQIAASPTP